MAHYYAIQCRLNSVGPSKMCALPINMEDNFEKLLTGQRAFSVHRNKMRPETYEALSSTRPKKNH